jgi:hypothetical protein
MDESQRMFSIAIFFYVLINAILFQILIFVSHIECEPDYLKFAPSKKKVKIRIKKPFNQKNLLDHNITWSTIIINLNNVITYISTILTFYQAHSFCFLFHFVYSVGIFAQNYCFKFKRKIKRFFKAKKSKEKVTHFVNFLR